MRNDILEANVVVARCKRTKKMYGIRVEKRTDWTWYCTWAFPISEKGASNEGYGTTMISGKVDLDAEYPGCPYCGTIGWVSCGKCGKLTCWENDENFECSWCGATGVVTVSETFDLTGGGY